MNFTCVLAMLAVAFMIVVDETVAEALSEERSNALWANYKAKHGKDYSESEDANRKAIFLQTYAKIEEHNNKQNEKWTMALNQFSDMVTENYIK